MLNLIRMDLYRMVRSKSLYVSLAFILFSVLACYGLIYLLGTPQGQRTAVSIGMLQEEDLEEASHILDGVDSLVFYRQSSLDGGAYNTIFGIVIALFLCMDFQSGYIKNVMALHRRRFEYVFSKLITAGIVSLFYLSAAFGVNALTNRLFGTMVPYAGWKDNLFYLSWVWIMTTAFAALVILACVFTRNTAAGVLTAVLFGSGIIVMPLGSITNIFHLGGWVKYTIYYNMSSGPSCYATAGDLSVFAVAIVFLVVYTTAAAVAISRQDI